MDRKEIRFIDLFAGIGGFHSAITRLIPKAECVSSVEFNSFAAKVYEETYGLVPLGDINDKQTLDTLDSNIGSSGFDILFGGFPCQSFSKAGNRLGFKDETRGTLFFSIEKILEKYKPRFFVLENVRNLISHKSEDGRKTFDIINEHLEKLGYAVQHSILSPHRLRNDTVPQMRERVFIYGILSETKEKMNEIRKRIESFFYKPSEVKIELRKLVDDYLDENSNNNTLDDNKLEVLNVWNDFYHRIKKDGNDLISPIWIDIFYNKDLQKSDLEWKQNIIDRNIEFYTKNKKVIDEWYFEHNELEGFIPSNRKFEWNANSKIDDLFKGIIQFRPSGVRVKKPDFFPTFVAINQKPVIGWGKRFITPSEISKLYGFKDLKLGKNDNESYKQLGNSVSVDVASIVINELLGE